MPPPPDPIDVGTEVGTFEGMDDGLLECLPEPRLPLGVVVLVGVADGLGLRLGVWLGE